MPYRYVPLTAGQYYHVFNRGVNREPIFLRKENWLFFLKRLQDYISDKADIIAYCLMPNHYHLLVCLKCDDFGPKVMQPFTVSYTKAINKQNNRVGPLFQGPYHAKLVEKDTHLLQLSRYIHLNPLRSGLVDKAEEWVYSSYPDYIGLRRGKIPKPGIILDHFCSAQAYVEFTEGATSDQCEKIQYLMMD
jgi:putative transposase